MLETVERSSLVGMKWLDETVVGKGRNDSFVLAYWKGLIRGVDVDDNKRHYGRVVFIQVLQGRWQVY